MKKVLHPELSYQITGILFQAHNQLGRFCRERQYQDFVEKKLQENQIRYIREYPIIISEGLKKIADKADFCIEEKVLLEFKAKPLLTKEDYYQVKRYLVISRKDLAILVNFHTKYLTPKRILHQL